MEKSVVEQERDLRDLIRRAKGQSNKTGTMRRDTLTRLISLTQSTQPASLKILAADGIQYFFKDFPELEEGSINAVYDLCEDQSPMVRIEGYKALAHMSRAQTKWVKRNADVLLQLLQSDEPDEVTVVKQSLLEHLELDPRITLSVLCDQIMPLEASSDDEEKGIRDRLRVLVLSFLADEAKHAISRRVTSGSEAEEVLVGDLLAAIPKLPPSDVAKIVKEILLVLPSYGTQSQQGKALLRVLLDLARDSLRKAIRGSASRQAISFEDTQFYLQLAHVLAVERSVAPATDLLAFYLSSLASKMTLQRLSPSAQALAIGQLADAFLASGRDDTSLGLVTEEETVKVRRQAVDACPVLFERLVDVGIVDSRTMGACIILLTECARRNKDTSWSIPAHFETALARLTSSPFCADDNTSGNDNVRQARHIKGLIRSIAPSLFSSAKPQQTQIAVKATDGRPNANTTARDSITRLPSASTSASSPVVIKRPAYNDGDKGATSISARITPKPGATEDRPLKRLKTEASPSLLSRMGTDKNSSNNSVFGAVMARQRNTMNATPRDRPRRSPVPQVNVKASPSSSGKVEGGISIKGAADRDGGRPSNGANNTASPASLLARLHANLAAPVNNNRGLEDRLGKRKGI